MCGDATREDRARKGVYVDVLQMVRQAVVVKPTLSDGWRDVRKEIPSPRKRVIVTDGNTVTMAWISATIKGTWEGWTILDNEYFGEAIAWRELPDPPAFA